MANLLRIGGSQRSEQRRRRLLQLPEPLQRAIADRLLPASAAQEILALPSDQIEQFAAAIVQGEPPRDVLQRFIANLAPRHPPVPKPSRLDVRADLELVILFFRSRPFRQLKAYVLDTGSASAREDLERVERAVDRLERRMGLAGKEVNRGQRQIGRRAHGGIND